MQLPEVAIGPALTDKNESHEQQDEDLLIFQQEDASPHYAFNIRQFLDQHFPRRSIGGKLASLRCY